MAIVAVAEAAIDPSRTDARDAQELTQKLDDLLARYLNTLDRYQQAREQLSSQLMSGNIALASANFANKGRRYGSDYYDERMQARRRVRITSSMENKDQAFEFAVQLGEEDPAGKEQNLAKSSSKDPLKWFGVLVPWSLRSAQSCYVAAVEASIPSLLNIQQDLRSLDIQIGRTRKALKKLDKL